MYMGIEGGAATGMQNEGEIWWIQMMGDQLCNRIWEFGISLIGVIWWKSPLIPLGSEDCAPTSPHNDF